jgi:hypothetical protein
VLTEESEDDKEADSSDEGNASDTTMARSTEIILRRKQYHNLSIVKTGELILQGDEGLKTRASVRFSFRVEQSEHNERFKFTSKVNIILS